MSSYIEHLFVVRECLLRLRVTSILAYLSYVVHLLVASFILKDKINVYMCTMFLYNLKELLNVRRKCKYFWTSSSHLIGVRIFMYVSVKYVHGMCTNTLFVLAGKMSVIL